MTDRSLDDFFGDERADDADDAGDREDEGVDGTGDEDAPVEEPDTGEGEESVGGASVDDPEEADTDADEADDPLAGLDLSTGPAESTMSWSPDGAACESCGDVVERRWRDDGRLVCLDCKEW